MRRRRGGPGILGTMAQTAVIAGTASVTMNAVNSRGAAKQQAAHHQATAAQAAADEAAATQARLAALE
ncbi:MAG: SHOCT domain-containing protein, partial [Chloroflexota bacterium]|nr:SHOCT domain-containing protein [Chloroflexota bacterium]